MNYSMTGEVIHKGELLTLNGRAKKEFHKLEVVLETEGEYPQKVKLEVLGNKAIKANDDISLGDFVEAMFDVRGNEYKGKYYVNLNMYQWTTVSAALDTQLKHTPDEVEESNSEEEKLPF